MRHTLFTLALFGALLLIREPVVAQPGGTDEGSLHAAHYADGLRAYVEGRYDQALEDLFRAYALAPSSHVMKLIIRTYDFMGHCLAAQRQTQMFRELHPSESVPQLQLCQKPGTLEIACELEDETIRVGTMIETRCGARLELPAGEHVVSSARLGRQKVRVEAGETAVAALRREPDPWHANEIPHHIEVPRMDEAQPVAVIRSADGSYEVWVPTDLREDPDMSGVKVVPRPSNLFPRREVKDEDEEAAGASEPRREAGERESLRVFPIE